MPPAIGVHIVKAFTFRGRTEEFENVYHYDRNPDLMSENDFSGLVDAIVAIEKTLHATTVSFLRATVHGPTHLTKDEDRMQFAKDLSGTGAIATSNAVPAEATVVAQLYMGRSPAPHFRKTFLRKFWRVYALSAAESTRTFNGFDALGTTNRDFYKGKMNALKTVVANGVNMNLCKPNGQGIPLGTDAFVLPYLHTRQLKQ